MQSQIISGKNLIAMQSVDSDSYDLWHRRLGHPSTQVFEKFKGNSENVPSMFTACLSTASPQPHHSLRMYIPRTSYSQFPFSSFVFNVQRHKFNHSITRKHNKKRRKKKPRRAAPCTRYIHTRSRIRSRGPAEAGRSVTQIVKFFLCRPEAKGRENNNKWTAGMGWDAWYKTGGDKLQLRDVRSKRKDIR
jgi:hypothetical protein